MAWMNIVDLTFLVQENSSSFWGAPIFVTSGTDYTFSYGVIRDLLRIRQRFGIIKWICILGRDSLDYVSDQNINTICNLFEHIDFPLILDSKNSTLSICSKFENGDKDDIVVVTSNSNILQLVDHYSHILLLQNDDYSVITTPDDVKRKIGVNYNNIATYNALTYCHGARKPLFTKRQAVRLVELYGDIYQIFNTLSNIPTSIRNKLSSDKDALLELYNRNTIQKIDEISLPIARPIHRDKCAPIFEKFEFFSLTRLLDAPPEFNVIKVSRKTSNYHPILDKENLNKLESRILSFEICSLDTESDGVNPKRATILGISFSVQEGTAYYLPLIDNDLKDITLDDVIKTLNRIFNSGLTFVGHNLKYDIQLLQTYGFKIAGQYFDTMLAAQDCFGDWEFSNLGYISSKLLNKEIKSYKNIVKGNQTFLDLPFKEIVKHGCEDADITLRLYRVLKKELDTKNILDWYYQQTIPKMLQLINYEYNGLNVNSKNLSSLRDSLLNEIKSLKTEIYNKVKF